MSDSQIIILDSYILATFPQVLDLSPHYYQLNTTTHVILDIKNNYSIHVKKRRKKKLLEKIESCSRSSKLKIHSIDFDTSYKSYHERGIENFTTSETSIVDLATRLAKNYAVKCATMNERLVRALKLYSIRTLTLNELIDIYSRDKGENANALKYKVYYDRKELVSIRNKVFLGILIVTILFLGYFYKELILNRLNATSTIFLTVVLAISLYLFRQKQRIAYGVFEFGVGLASVILIFYPTFSFTTVTFDLSFSIRYLGGLYVMIRGIDNIIKGISKTRTGEILKYKFDISSD